MSVEPDTAAWCKDRDHPYITYNPWFERSYCRCGKRQEIGQQPMGWEAKHEVFHAHAPGAPCRCYL
ncbi:hypothetical protein [Streptomyces nigrescens]|uniref:hypothetical protein n=1 Tax=Streptomyces nigrescens TaxID=1920 RepID=UPI00370142B2